jgi:hypothetical protein
MSFLFLDDKIYCDSFEYFGVEKKLFLLTIKKNEVKTGDL